MKKMIAMTIMAIAIGCMASSAMAVSLPAQNVSITVQTALSIEYDTAANCTFPGTTIPWTNINPVSTLEYPTGGHSATKPDVGVICKNNGATWYLKMNLTTTNLTGKISRSISQPVNRNTSTATNGTVAGGVDAWVVVPAAATNVYTSNNDTVNTPLGTFVGIYYGLNPTGLQNGTSYTGTITYTLSNTL